MTNIRFDRDFTIEGFWNLPNSSDKVFGILTYKPGKDPNLHAIGSLCGKKAKELITSDEHYELVQGKTIEGVPFTLLNCVSDNLQITRDSIPIIDYRCQFVLQGIALEDRKQPIFKLANVEMTGLSDWCPPTKVDTPIYEMQSPKGSDYTRLDVRWKGKGISRVQINDNTFLGLGISIDENNSLIDNGVVSSIRYYTNYVIEKVQYSSLEELIRDMSLFNQFVSFGLAQDAKILAIVLQTKGYSVNSLKLVYKNSSEKEYHFAPKQILFTYCAIEKYYPTVIRKWYESKDYIEPIRNYLLETIKPSRNFISSDFLKIAIALDSFYSRSIKNRVHLEPAISSLVSKYKDINILAKDHIKPQAVAETRDTLVHFMKNKKKQLLEGQDLYEQTWYLRKLLICCVMSYLLGIDKHAELNDILNHSHCWLLCEYKDYI